MIAGSYFVYVWDLGAQKNEEIMRQNEFCYNWDANLDQQRAELDADIFASESLIAQFNAEIADYNRQCAY